MCLTFKYMGAPLFFAIYSQFWPSNLRRNGSSHADALPNKTSRDPNFAEVLSTPLSTIVSHRFSRYASQPDGFNHRRHGIEFVEQNSTYRRRCPLWFNPLQFKRLHQRKESRWDPLGPSYASTAWCFLIGFVARTTYVYDKHCLPYCYC